MDIRLNNLGVSGRHYIGITASQEYTVGLFEVLRIQQLDRIESILWIRAVVSPFQGWIRAHAQLTDDPFMFIVQESEQINLLCDNRLRFDESGRIQAYQVAPASLTRIPYTVSFWEETDSFPVYTLYPDNRLPWIHTVRSAFRLPFMPTVPSLRGTQYAPRPVRVLANDAVCAITLEPLFASGAHWTPCGHAFSTAIIRALETAPRCPLCRAPCSTADLELPT